MSRYIQALLLMGAALMAQQAGNFRLLRSLSGPSGKVVGSKFVLDEMRNRFVCPQDKSFVVYFEWDGPAADHVLTATWKAPDGRVASISPDIKMQTTARDFAAYWIYDITPQMASGIWTVEIRIDGEPAGSHSFELVVPVQAEAPRPEPPPKPITADDIYRQTRGSVVWVHKLDDTGRRIDTSSGYVSAKNQVTTAFQAIDAAAKLEVEFEGGRRVSTDAVVGCSRLQDWAVLSVDTADVKPLARGDAAKAAVGERLLAFNGDATLTRTFGGVDLGGHTQDAALGDRLQIAPTLSPEAAGAPLLSLTGEVLGILGGSKLPGARFGRRGPNVNPALHAFATGVAAATPVHLVRHAAAGSTTLAALRDSGILSTAIDPFPSLAFGGTTRSLKGVAGGMPADASEFSRNDPEVCVYSMWQRKDKTSKGVMAATVYDVHNRKRVTVAPKKISIPVNSPSMTGFTFVPRDLEAGFYRIDLLFDEKPVWRTFVRIVD